MTRIEAMSPDLQEDSLPGKPLNKDKQYLINKNNFEQYFFLLIFLMVAVAVEISFSLSFLTLFVSSKK